MTNRSNHHCFIVTSQKWPWRAGNYLLASAQPSVVFSTGFFHDSSYTWWGCLIDAFTFCFFNFPLHTITSHLPCWVLFNTFYKFSSQKYSSSASLVKTSLVIKKHDMWGCMLHLALLQFSLPSNLRFYNIYVVLYNFTKKKR